MTQADLAAVVLPESGRAETISGWERDKSAPDATALAGLAKALGVSADWLLFGGERQNGQPAAPELEPATDDEILDLAARLDAIDHSDLSEVLKILKMEALSAAIRAQQADREARAAEIRARAVERAEKSAEARARAIDRAEASASQRAAALASAPTSSELVEAILQAGQMIQQMGGLTPPGGASPTANKTTDSPG